MNQERAKKFRRLHSLAVIAKLNLYGFSGTLLIAFLGEITASFFFSAENDGFDIFTILSCFSLILLLSAGALLCILARSFQKEEMRSSRRARKSRRLQQEMTEEQAAEVPPQKPPKKRGVFCSFFLGVIRFAINMFIACTGICVIIMLIDMAKSYAHSAAEIAEAEGATLFDFRLPSLLLTILPIVLSAILMSGVNVHAYRVMQEDIGKVSQSLSALETCFQEPGNEILVNYPRKRWGGFSYCNILVSNEQTLPVGSIRHRIVVDRKGRIREYNLHVKVDENIPLAEQLQYFEDAYQQGIEALEKVNIPWSNGRTDNMCAIPAEYEEAIKGLRDYESLVLTIREGKSRLHYDYCFDDTSVVMAELSLYHFGQ